MPRILAIDYGKKRIGLAVTDPLKMIANGLDTVATHTIFNYLESYFEKEEVDTIVIGAALQMSGEESETMKQIHPFKRRLEKLYPDKKIVFVDERFTSVLAQKAIIEGGIKKQERRHNKGLVDKVSATIILQSYLEQTNPFTI